MGIQLKRWVLRLSSGTLVGRWQEVPKLVKDIGCVSEQYIHDLLVSRDVGA